MIVSAKEVDALPTSDPIPNLEFARLHITPFNPSLLNVIVPPSILPSVKNVSYHSLQTFPEKSYGYLELPKMDAEKIKKKLNGSILKGSKVRIEEARPSKQRSPVMDTEETAPKERKEKVDKGLRKRKRHEEILPGVELRDRKVQRGWTSPAVDTKKSDKRQKDKKEKKTIPAKSKFTNQPECLFKTSLPPSVAAHLAEDPSDSSVKRRKIRGSGNQVVVHEFSKTTKHATFLRGSGVSSDSPAVAEYVEGKGWVDKDGNVVEAEVTKKKRSDLVIRNDVVNADSDSSSEDSASSEDEVEDSMMKTPTPVAREASLTSSSGSSSEDEEEGEEETEESDSSSDSSSDSEDIASVASQPQEDPPSRPTTSSSTAHPHLHLQIPPTSTPTQIHPLEALYKKPAQATTSTPSFSFFNNEDTEDQAGPSIPMTPFTQQDLEFRGLRSAAPTPDTAHPGKMFPRSWPSNTQNEDEDDDEESSPIPNRSAPTTTAKGEEEPQSEFQKWFYEHRGEANRAWKKRRKVVGKEKRHKENKKRGGV